MLQQETMMNDENAGFAQMRAGGTMTALPSLASPGSALDRYYQQGWAGKDELVAAFREQADDIVYPALEQALRDNENANARNAAMEVYAALGAERSRPLLLQLLVDKDEEIRIFAANILGTIRDRGAVPELITALSDPDLNVKHAAAEALGRIKDPRAVDALIESLNTDMWLQFPAAMALGAIGDRRAVQPLLALLTVPGANIPAIQALGKIGDCAALDPLGIFLEDEEPSLREWALDAVAGIAVKNRGIAASFSLSDKAVGLLINMLLNDSLKTRRNAAIVLGFSRSARALPVLQKLMTDADLRDDALEAIIRITGEKKSVQAAARSADFHPLVRRTAPDAINSQHAIDPADMALLRDHISEHMGLHFDDDRLHVLHHRLEPFAVLCGFTSLREYARHIVHAPLQGDLLKDLAGRLTNNETYFFRELEQLHVFINTLLPPLVEQAAGSRKKLRILSAGCSSGEEAYTIAMLIEEAGVRACGCDVEVLGVDINAAALDTAVHAHYSPRSFRKNDNGLVKKYFQSDDSGFLVGEQIRNMVTFQPGNVLDPAVTGEFDVIFCRNLLIYFSDRSLERTARNFHRMLSPGGYLFLGHAESLCRVRTDFVPIRLEGAVAYWKQ